MALETAAFDDRVAALEAAVEARTRDLRAALDQRTALLHELDHRVKNNLQLISSLMMMQARRSQEPAVKAALDAMHERLNAVATVHRRLFQREDVQAFDLAEFVRDLVSDLAHAADRPGLTFDCRLAPIQAPAAKAASLALLINELLTNAIRHAFPANEGGRVTIAIETIEQSLRIEITDDGVGMGGPSIGAESETRSFGLMIVDLLSRQLQASITREAAHPGLRTVVDLPLDSLRGAS